MKYKGYIYCIQNKVNGKKYIGQTYNKKGYKCRWSQHKDLLKRNKHGNKRLQNDYNTFGLEAFEFILIHEFQANSLENLWKTLDNMEKYYIKSWNLLNENFGYNINDGGTNGNPFAGKSQEEIKNIFYNRENSNIILCIETGDIFKTSDDVINTMFNGKGYSSHIRANICGQRKSAYGYHFKYIERENY